MKDPKIQSSLRTHWPSQWEIVKQPDGLDYSKLLESLEKKSNVLETNKTAALRDLRKQSYLVGDQNGNENNSVIDNLDKKSIIPIPGMLIEYENSESDVRPPDSDWKGPNGIPYNPMTF